ncbi:MAG TPA: hypothetical protein PKJ98_19470 [Verrucomicrobiota bacterium]|nr:hypothetical protein [Verrucomicrobiota bacterium]
MRHEVGIDGDRKPDVGLMGDERTQLNSLCWFSIPANPRQPWSRHLIGPPVHGAITPNGAMDLDGDGDLDVLRADTWYENRDGQGGTMDGRNCRSPMGCGIAREGAYLQTWESKRSVRMENVGEGDLVNPWLSNGRNTFRSVAEIVATAFEPPGRVATGRHA